MKELRNRLTETFQTSEDATPEELEACWQQKRKRSQEYQQLKRSARAGEMLREMRRKFVSLI